MSAIHPLRPLEGALRSTSSPAATTSRHISTIRAIRPAARHGSILATIIGLFVPYVLFRVDGALAQRRTPDDEAIDHDAITLFAVGRAEIERGSHDPYVDVENGSAVAVGDPGPAGCSGLHHFRVDRPRQDSAIYWRVE